MRLTKAATFLLISSARGTRAFAQRNKSCSAAVHKNWLTIYGSSSTCAWGITTANRKNHLLPRGGASFSSSVATSTTYLNSAVTDADVTTQPAEILRSDYAPLPFTVKEVTLDFQIHPGKTIVTTEMLLQENTSGNGGPLTLDGDESSVKLVSISVNGKDLSEGGDYSLEPGKLILKHPVDGALVKTVVEICPEENTQLSGLYKSSGMYCSQCEAMGFRRITYFPDRPDNMSVYKSVRMEANKEDVPLLLSNGNLMESGDLPEGKDDQQRHYAVWSDPFPKPSYLFAVVAGSLGQIEDSYTTTSGRKVTLRLFSEAKNVDKLDYAMEALKRSMKWDEDRFGLEYDLDLFNVVAVDDFNMGAMENKSLNVFNTAYVLADKATATDTDFERVEAVIGHEYFHNWTGNRVTCRDWFQLTLKEGLTVFRDQEFSADMMGAKSAAVKRIMDVRGLRARQFQEDAGPMSHPIRPDSYISMDNFYTATVYIKGAEIIRMYQTLLGVEGFRKGMDKYFERHDGSAVTCVDFLDAMADANGADLSQFSRWYNTAGTPVVTYKAQYEAGTYKLTLSQSSNSKDGPLHIPISIGLLDKATGKEIVPTSVLDLKQESQTFEFAGLKSDDVVLSLLRGFSAPVKIVSAEGDGEGEEESMAFLAANDTDGFNRWEAGQKLYTTLIFQTMKDGVSAKTEEYVIEAIKRALEGNDASQYSFQAYALSLPTESTLAEDMDVVDPIAIHKARGSIKQWIARKVADEVRTKYDELSAFMENETEFKVDAEAIGRRRLRNVLLEYLCSIKETDEEQITAADLAKKHFDNAQGMTDKMSGLNALASMSGKGAVARDEALKQFYEDANGDALVLNKWFGVQAMADLPDVLDRVKALKDHPDFTLRNPNRCRSLLGAYATNEAAFHDEAGESYKFMGEILTELDQLNPQVSSRMAGSLIQWRRYGEARGLKMKAELENLASLKLSDDLYEIVTKGLK